MGKKIFLSNNRGRVGRKIYPKYSKKLLTNNTNYDTIKVGKNPNSIRKSNKKRKEK